MVSQPDSNLTWWRRQEKWMLFSSIFIWLLTLTVSLNILINNLTKYSLDKQTERQIKNWLNSRSRRLWPAARSPVGSKSLVVCSRTEYRGLCFFNGWDGGTSAPSKTLKIMQNWGDWLIVQIGVLWEQTGYIGWEWPPEVRKREERSPSPGEE